MWTRTTEAGSLASLMLVPKNCYIIMVHQIANQYRLQIMPFKICKKVFKLEITSMKVGDSDVCDATFCWWQFENLGDTIFMLSIEYVSGINSQICHSDTAVLLYWCWWHMLNTRFVGNKHSLPTSVSHDNFQSNWLVLLKGKLDAIKLMVSYGFRLSFLNSS